jgi:seryl-tRNA synthetase
MLDIKYVRENKDKINNSLEKRGISDKKELIETIFEQDKKWRFLKQKSDKLRSKRNELTEKIRLEKKEGKDIGNSLSLAKEIPKNLESIENEMNALKEEVNLGLSKIPNVLHDSVPKGNGEDENVPFKFFGKKTQHAFEIKSHGEILEGNGLANFDSGRINSGQGFNYLLGDLALLDRALQQLGVDMLVKKGFKLVSPPVMLNKKTISGTVNLEEFEDVIYKLDNEDLYLIATGEHPLVSLFRNKTFRKEELPIKLVTVTPCFRKEIGSHGVDTKGLFRMHQFYKVEQVVISDQESSWQHLEEMEKISEDFYKKLGVPYRVIEICSGDLGYKQAKQYDIEAWFPRQNAYKEITSASNTTSYQSVPLNIKYIDGEEKKYVHMLNNTMVATSRTMVAIVENFQNKDGTVTMPKPLRKYMFNTKKMGESKK